MARCTLAELRTQVKADLFPMGEAENLVALHNRYILEALIDLQRWVDCLQERNTKQTPFCSTLFYCGTTVADKARGRLRSIYTIANGDWCDRVFYNPASFSLLTCFAKGRLAYAQPPNTGMPVIGQGYKYADKITDSLCGTGRTRCDGQYAIDGGRLYLAPWIQSNESVVQEYDGIKRDWTDTDLTNNDPDFLKAVGYYVLMQKAVKQGCASDAYLAARKEYEDQRADLMFECEEEKKEGTNRFCNDESPMDVRTDDAVSTSDNPVVIAVIGDYGNFAEIVVPGVMPEEEVATLVKSWSPAAILTVGDNNYPDGEASTIDSNVGKFYADYIFPYKGSYGFGSQAKNKFWPVMGNHDWDTANGLPYREYFSLPGNGRYYDVVIGPVHFFFISTDPREPDGITEGSVQGAWVHKKAALSEVQWKVLIGHHPPYTSDINHSPGSIPGRWQFRNWGIDAAVFGHGHNYERLDSGDGFPIFVNGLGGKEKRGFVDPPVAQSQSRYSDEYGAMKIEATCDYLRFTFINKAGVTVETMTIESKLAADGFRPHFVGTSELVGSSAQA